MGFLATIFGAPSTEEIAEQNRHLAVVEANYRARQEARLNAAQAEGFDVTEEREQLEERNRIVDGHLQAGAIDVDAEIDEAFNEGLQEGAANVTSILSKPFEVAGAGILAVLKAIPFWVWLLVGAVLFFYVGGPALLLPMLKRKK
jgi:hypothetical protein